MLEFIKVADVVQQIWLYNYQLSVAKLISGRPTKSSVAGLEIQCCKSKSTKSLWKKFLH